MAAKAYDHPKYWQIARKNGLEPPSHTLDFAIGADLATLDGQT